jgi:ketosteroid isomerase-like protein
MKLQRSSTMNRCIPHLTISMAMLSFAFGQLVAQQESQSGSSEKEVREMIEKYRTAILQRDIPALEKIWADDYIFVNASGEVVPKAQRLANIKSGATALDSIMVRVYQNSAVATSRVTIKGQYGGQPTSGQYRSTHVCVKGPAGWQLVSNQVTALESK